jgi:hypothetical protein
VKEAKKFLIFFCIVLQQYGCKNKVENSIKTSIYLQDSIYKITFDKPLELDTFYSWRDEGCHGCDDYNKICFSKSVFPIEMKSGMLFKNFADSSYRFIIEHNYHFKCKSSYSFELSKRIRKNRLIYLKQTFAEADTLFMKNIKLNNYDIRVEAYKARKIKSFSEWNYFITANSVIDSNFISFTADCQSKNCDGFIERFEKVINSLEIERVK